MLNGNKFCECIITTECRRGKDSCQCKSYCGLHARAVAGFTNTVCATISPNPNSIESYHKTNSDWAERFYKLRKHLSGGVIVLELAGLRPHYHCIFDVRDKIGFTATLLSWSKYDNVKKHNMFSGGVHYIFKEVDLTRDLTGIEPVLTYGDLITRERELYKQKLLARLQRKQDLLQEVNKDIPEWMRGGDE